MTEEDGKWSDWKSFAALKGAEAWAGEKFLGNKALLMESYLRWQELPIHTTLCKYDSLRTDKAKFKDVTTKAKDS